MQKPVYVLPDELGNVVRISKNNPEYGHVIIQQERTFIDSNNWVKTTNLTTLIQGKLDDLEGFKDLKELPGKIVVKEQTTPFNIENPDADLKIAGTTGIPCTFYGEPIYRKTFYTVNTSENDLFVKHTNSDDIKNASGKVQEFILSNEQVQDVIQADPEEDEFTDADDILDFDDTTVENTSGEVEFEL